MGLGGPDRGAGGSSTPHQAAVGLSVRNLHLAKTPGVCILCVVGWAAGERSCSHLPCDQKPSLLPALPAAVRRLSLSVHPVPSLPWLTGASRTVVS